jgi:AcrR family transcriptional regulator
MPQTRREERREATIEEIKDLAWKQMAENGPTNLSLRQISADMRMSSAALFRYFPNRKALLMALSYDAFQAQVGALNAVMESSAGQSSSERLMALGIAYRRWAVENPIQYALVYGTPVPGFQPDWNELVPVAQGGLVFLLQLLQAGITGGSLALPAHWPPFPAGLQQHLERIIAERSYPFSMQALYLGIIIWSRIHGLVSLELNGQLNILVQDPDELFRYEVEIFLQALKTPE